MRGYLTHIGCLAVITLLATAPRLALQAAEVKNARVWAGLAYTRVVFDLSGPVHYTFSQQGEQIGIELADSSLGGRRLAPQAQGLFKGLMSAARGRSLRLIAFVAPHSQPKTFVLGPSGQAGYRLVLDIYPGRGTSVPDKDGSPAVASSKPAQASSNFSLPWPPQTAPMAVNASSKLSSRKGVTTRQAAALLNSQRQVIVAVDAGHGGKDQGAHGPHGTLEKNVTLAVARQLAALINRQPGMKAILTREGDYFIPLKQRYEIARQNQADLFISVHADSYTSSDARGSSVWVLSPRGKSSVAAQMLADRENSSDLIGGVSLAAENDSLASVLLDMQQGWAVQASERVGESVLNTLSALGPTHRGYVEHANFVVLRSPDVPSILVETAFISNPREERKLRDAAHQQQLAAAIMNGVKGYFLSDPPPDTWFAMEAARRKGVLPHAAISNTVASTSEADGADGRDIHRVAIGETLRSIAKQYGVSVDSLKSVNGISSNSVRSGTMLVIPSS